MNPGGSVKDRTAYGIITDAEGTWAINIKGTAKAFASDSIIEGDAHSY